MSNLISTTELARARGQNCKTLTRALARNGFIKRGKDRVTQNSKIKCWVLTDKGKKHGGSYSPNLFYGRKYIVWPQDVEFPISHNSSKTNKTRHAKDIKPKNKARKVDKWRRPDIDFCRSKNPRIYWARGPLSDYSKNIQSKIKELKKKGIIGAWEAVYNFEDYIHVKFLDLDNIDNKTFPSEFWFSRKMAKRSYYDIYDEDPYAHGWSLEEEMDYYGYEGPKNDLVAYENWRDIQN